MYDSPERAGSRLNDTQGCFDESSTLTELMIDPSDLNKGVNNISQGFYWLKK